MRHHTSLCPGCGHPAEIVQRDLRFFCLRCDKEFHTDAKTFIGLIPEKPTPSQGFRDMMPWLFLLGVTTWAVIAFTVFHLFIFWEEAGYRRGVEDMVEVVGAVNYGWQPIQITTEAFVTLNTRGDKILAHLPGDKRKMKMRMSFW
jgi:hypothetical protein